MCDFVGLSSDPAELGFYRTLMTNILLSSSLYVFRFQLNLVTIVADNTLKDMFLSFDSFQTRYRVTLSWCCVTLCFTLLCYVYSL